MEGRGRFNTIHIHIKLNIQTRTTVCKLKIFKDPLCYFPSSHFLELSNTNSSASSTLYSTLKHFLFSFTSFCSPLSASLVGWLSRAFWGGCWVCFHLSWWVESGRLWEPAIWRMKYWFYWNDTTQQAVLLVFTPIFNRLSLWSYYVYV